MFQGTSQESATSQAPLTPNGASDRDVLKISHPAEIPPDKATDPLREYLQQLRPESRPMTEQVSQPIAERTATTHGSKTLRDFATLKYREAKGLLGENEAEYARYGTPILRRVENALAKLDGGEQALIFRSGMAAIETLIHSILPSNGSERGHIIAARQGYRQTNAILEELRARGWAEVDLIDVDDFNNLNDFMKPTTVGIIFETPSNPFLRVIDVAAVKKQVRDCGSQALVIADHTFAGPHNQRPLEQGADVVIPSLTKYISGSNQALAGAIIGSKERLLPMYQRRSRSGNIGHDIDCLEIESGIATLAMRTAQANENGLHVANILGRHPLVRQLWYPGHPSHPDYSVATKQMSGFGGVVSFRLAARDMGDVAAFVDAFIEASPEGTFLAPSFGGDKPLISAVTVVSHFQQSPEERAARGIPFDLIRLSTGTILPQQLTDAIEAGFTAVESRQGNV
jgi:cystathionine beta-lyase/cystathionine gamma-synthase